MKADVINGRIQYIHDAFVRSSLHRQINYRVPDTLPLVVVPGNTIELPCNYSQETVIVGAALEPKLTLTCQKDGKFPDPSQWDKCAKYVIASESSSS